MRRLSVLLLLLVPACAPATQTTVAPPEAGFMGNYAVRLEEADLPQQQRSASAGAWTFAFQGGDRFVWRRDASEVVRGRYELRGNQITFPGPETGSAACSATGVYAWQIADDQLTFTRVSDSCLERIAVLTSRPLVRRP